MQIETRKTDSKCRVVLPNGFANATVIIERMDDTEVRVRLASVVPLNEARFAGEFQKVLTDEERDWFLELMDNPPPANDALLNLLAKPEHDSVAD